MPSFSMDEIDRRILSVLQSDARISNVLLADQVGLSPSPCLRRVRLLEEEGVIEGYGARVNRQKVGLGLTAFVTVNIHSHGEDTPAKFKDAARAMPEIVSCHTTSGDHDFLLQAVVPDLEVYRQFVDRLIRAPGVRNIRSSFAYETVKEAGLLPLPNWARGAG
jgi:Lrp/AsnC family leucine-responsive transcriptional regulator